MRKKRKPKDRYRLRNWKEYNAALRRRGSLTLWMDEQAIAGWIDTESVIRIVDIHGSTARWRSSVC
jgi:hypothetical protein